MGGRVGGSEELKIRPTKVSLLGCGKSNTCIIEEPDGSEVFGQETDQEEYFYVNALNDFDMESDDTEDDEDITMLVVRFCKIFCFLTK